VRFGRALLRIAVPTHVVELDERYGHGRVWRRTLAELDRHGRIVVADVSQPVRADVWLGDGGADLPDSGLPLVVHLHEAPWVDPALRAQVDERFAEYMDARTRTAVERADRVVTVSHHAARQINEAYAPRAVDVAYNGVDHRVFRPGRRPPRDPLPPDFVLFAGTVHPRKNFVALREAMNLLGWPMALVAVAGPTLDRPGSAEIEAVLLDEPVVRVERPSDRELAGLMGACRAFCLPSLSEGFGLTALEALACGAPCVVSNRGALPEVVGEAALLVDPEPSAIAAGLETVLAEPDVWRARGPKQASRFTWRATADAWLASLHTAIASRVA
jgi:glycosyltransferase involved in cell wall biosynthesis